MDLLIINNNKWQLITGASAERREEDTPGRGGG